MSARNHPMNKALRRQQRAMRYKRAARGIDRRGKAIPFHGAVVSCRMVKGQRYLQSVGLPFSKNVADVVIPADIGGMSDDEVAILLSR